LAKRISYSTFLPELDKVLFIVKREILLKPTLVKTLKYITYFYIRFFDKHFTRTLSTQQKQFSVDKKHHNIDVQ